MSGWVWCTVAHVSGGLPQGNTVEPPIICKGWMSSGDPPTNRSREASTEERRTYLHSQLLPLLSSPPRRGWTQSQSPTASLPGVVGWGQGHRWYLGQTVTLHLPVPVWLLTWSITASRRGNGTEG